jgi:hypothetical protein
MLPLKSVPTQTGEYIIAPLTLRQVEDSANFSPKRAVSLALGNAGNPISEDALSDELTLPALKTLAEAVMELSGLGPVKPGEDLAVEETLTTSTAA